MDLQENSLMPENDHGTCDIQQIPPLSISIDAQLPHVDPAVTHGLLGFALNHHHSALGRAQSFAFRHVFPHRRSIGHETKGNSIHI